MARLDNNSSPQPAEREEKINVSPPPAEARFDLTEVEDPAGKMSLSEIKHSFALFPFYQAETGLPLQTKSPFMSDTSLMSPNETNGFPDLETLQQMTDLRTDNDRLTEKCAEWESRADERLSQLNALTMTLDIMCNALKEELHGPLRWIVGFSQLLSEKAKSPDETDKDYAERIEKSALRLEKLLQDLLKYGRLNLEPAVCAPVSLQNCLGEALVELAEVIQNRFAEVHIEGPLPQVKADASLLKLVFSHLIENALKFVAPDTTPNVRIWAESAPTTIRVYIEDNGIGVPPEQNARIFGLFQRLSDTYPGTGVGLTLVQKAMEKIGGQVDVEPGSAGGSRFWIELPTPH